MPFRSEKSPAVTAPAGLCFSICGSICGNIIREATKQRRCRDRIVTRLFQRLIAWKAMQNASSGCKTQRGAQNILSFSAAVSAIGWRL
jgi:hypothetical protein